jgi:hypothetical protein
VDGKYFYFKKGEEVWKVPIEGGEETLVTTERVNFANYWALGSQGLYFTQPRAAEHKTTLKLLRFGTGQISQIAVLPQPFRHEMRLSLPASGRWLLYNQLDRYESDIVLIENFHWEVARRGAGTLVAPGSAVVPGNHPHVATALNNLAETQRCLRTRQTAEQNYRAALAVIEQC